ncbi:ankyrin, partial [Hypoxylon sp. EC38]
MSFPIGSLLSAIAALYSFIADYKALGGASPKLTAEAESLRNKLEWTKQFAEPRKDKLSSTHGERLGERCKQSEATLKKARKLVSELGSKIGKAKLATIDADKLDELVTELRNHRDVIDGIVGEMIMDSVARIEAELSHLAKSIQYGGSSPRVSEADIPRGTSDFTKHLHMDGQWVDTRDPESSNTSLHIALYNQNLELAQLLLNHGADPAEKTDGNKNTAVHLAAEYLPNVLDLMRHRVLKEATSDGIGSGTRNTSTRKKEDIRKQEWKNLLKCKNDDGQTPLHIAVFARSVEGVKWLCEELKAHGESLAINIKDNKDQTPLHTLAALNVKGSGRSQRGETMTIARVLAESGHADLTLKDKDGLTPLKLAKNHEKTALEAYLRGEGEKRPKHRRKAGRRGEKE